MYPVTLIPGDGIGPEITAVARRVLEATGVPFDWHVHDAGEAAIRASGTPLPDSTLAAIQRDRVALKGPITTPIGTGFRSVNVQLRQRLDLFANVRLARTLPAVPTRFESVDLVLIRENTEGLYSGLEHVVVPGVVESVKIVTERASERIARVAFALARSERRRTVTAVHKANIMKLSDGLFLDACRRVAADYPDVTYEESLVDATAMRLVLDPRRFDVLVMENLYGDILSDLTAGLIGGLGLAPSANLGEHCAVFEAVHGSAPDIAGQNLANPLALILSGVMLLGHVGEHEASQRLAQSVERVLQSGVRTRDLGGTATTAQVGEAIERAVKTLA